MRIGASFAGLARVPDVEEDVCPWVSITTTLVFFARGLQARMTRNFGVPQFGVPVPTSDCLPPTLRRCLPSS